MRKLLLLLFGLFLWLNMMAQLEVKEDSFKEVAGFVNINTEMMYDDNDKPYAVLKVKTENINNKERRELLFQGDARTFIECEYKVGEVWLYISYYATYLKVSHPDYGSTEFWFPFDMQGKKGYELTLFNKPSVDEDFQKRLERLERELSIQQPQTAEEEVAVENVEEPINNVKTKKKHLVNSSVNKGWSLDLEIGAGYVGESNRYDIGTKFVKDYKNNTSYDININARYKFNKHIYLGFGLGADIKALSMISVPIYLSPRFYVNVRKVSLYFDVKLGWAISIISSDCYLSSVPEFEDSNYSTYTKYGPSKTKFSGLFSEFGVGLKYNNSSFGVALGMNGFHSKIGIYEDHEYTKSLNYYPMSFMLKYGYSIFGNKK